MKIYQQIDDHGKLWTIRDESNPYIPEEHSEEEFNKLNVVFQKMGFFDFPPLHEVVLCDSIKVMDGKLAGWKGDIALRFASGTIIVPSYFSETDAAFRDALFHIAKGDYSEWKLTPEYVPSTREEVNEYIDTLKSIGPSASAFVTPSFPEE